MPCMFVAHTYCTQRATAPRRSLQQHGRAALPLQERGISKGHNTTGDLQKTQFFLMGFVWAHDNKYSLLHRRDGKVVDCVCESRSTSLPSVHGAVTVEPDIIHRGGLSLKHPPPALCSFSLLTGKPPMLLLVTARCYPCLLVRKQSIKRG